MIRTPMVEATHPDQVRYMTDKIPAKRTGTLDEVAALARWIVSDEASFCTGFTFDLSGGRAVYWSQLTSRLRAPIPEALGEECSHLL